ncbi:MAG: acyltransferase [Burkholderiaceae bacterium]|nr:MAG: acyltransferase [Burkholderiaceae bacterium]
MKHRILHSLNLRNQLDGYAQKMGVPLLVLTEAYDWMCAHNVVFEDVRRDGTVQCYVAYVNIEKRIEHPLARRFYAVLRDEVPATLLPLYGINWPTLVDRCRRVWEQIYNMLINKIPSHTLRLAWLRLGGARIGPGSTLWRNTEVIGMENLQIGQDTCVGWHCQLDARAGLIIGDHVTIASHTIIIAGGHDLKAPEFWGVGAPIFIGDYAWITTRVILLAGAHIGEGAVVAANTVVAKTVAPYAIVGGEGARVLGERVRGLNYKVGGKGLFTLLH